MNYSDRLAHAYFFAKNYIISKGYSSEIDWQSEASLGNVSEEKFLNEIAWVIIASGMNDKVVRKVFPLLRDAMLGFQSPEAIILSRKKCFGKAIKIFNHEGKINAIFFAAEYLCRNNIEQVNYKLLNEGIPFILSFPYMGKATSYHLAKNLGLNCVKPDRHLVRISATLGFSSPTELCSQISNRIQESVSIIDLVLWRYSTLDKNYIENIRWYLNRSKVNA